MKRKRRRIIIISIIVIVLFILAVGYYRSNLNYILNQEDYLNSTSSQIFLLHDSKFYEINDFSQEDLSFPVGTKVSGYNELLTKPMTINQDFINGQIAAINALIAGRYYENWDNYSVELQNSLGSIFNNNDSQVDFFKDSSCYSPSSLEDLQLMLQKLQEINTGKPIEVTLNNVSLMKTGFLMDTANEYDKLANEAILGNINNSTFDFLSKLSTDNSRELKVINNDHCFAIVSINGETLIQGESKVQELKNEYSAGITNSQYYNMLIERVDRLRLYPQISFTYNDKQYPVYLVDVLEDSNKKNLVLMIKDYNQDLTSNNKINCLLNTQDYPAYVVPRSAIISKDNTTYIQVLKKGYFTREIEVKVSLYDKGKAILRVSENPDLESGTTIKLYP